MPARPCLGFRVARLDEYCGEGSGNPRLGFMHFACGAEGPMEGGLHFLAWARVRVCLSTQEPKSRPKP